MSINKFKPAFTSNSINAIKYIQNRHWCIFT